MTGLELAQQMRMLCEDVPIVMATGFSGAVNPSEVRELGIEELVSKPLTSREVGEVIRRVLDKHAPSSPIRG